MVVDGVSLEQELLDNKLAYRYDGGKNRSNLIKLLSKSASSLLIERKAHPDVDDMLNGVLLGKRGVSGIYFVGCGDRIVYIGQSQAIGGITCRSVESLARYYHQINDTTLPWSIGLAPVSPNEGEHYTVLLNELESNAIRKFSPIFNTSIPNKNNSKVREPNITHIARVFTNQTEECTAFELNNIEKQSIESKLNTEPPWKSGIYK